MSQFTYYPVLVVLLGNVVEVYVCDGILVAKYESEEEVSRAIKVDPLLLHWVMRWNGVRFVEGLVQHLLLQEQLLILMRPYIRSIDL